MVLCFFLSSPLPFIFISPFVFKGEGYPVTLTLFLEKEWADGRTDGGVVDAASKSTDAAGPETNPRLKRRPEFLIRAWLTRQGLGLRNGKRIHPSMSEFSIDEEAYARRHCLDKL